METQLTDLTVILNPAAGGGAGARMRPAIERELARCGIRAGIRETRFAGEATGIASQLATEGAPIVAAAGGDGTVHEVANGLLSVPTQTVPTLGVIPIGSGNDFVKLLGTRGLAAAAARIAAGRVRRFDVGRVEWGGESERFVNGMGTGVDVEVLRQLMRQPRLPGFAGYALAAARALVRFKPVRLRIETETSRTDDTVLILAVGNGVCQGGGFYFWPRAQPDDGALDICIIQDVGLPRIAVTFPKIMRGRHSGTPGIIEQRSRSLQVSPVVPEPMFFQLDGEVRCAAAGESVIVSVEAHALPVFADESES